MIAPPKTNPIQLNRIGPVVVNRIQLQLNKKWRLTNNRRRGYDAIDFSQPAVGKYVHLAIRVA